MKADVHHRDTENTEKIFVFSVRLTPRIFARGEESSSCARTAAERRQLVSPARERWENETFVCKPRSGDTEDWLIESNAAAPRLRPYWISVPSADALGYRAAAAPRLTSAS